MFMRHLASIKTIRELHPIKGADRIERAVIDGWDVVVKKDEFKVGDPCVYVECDSILPVDNPNFAFLEGKRIKIKRLRGIYSYGIAFPVEQLFTSKTFVNDRGQAYTLGEGDDVTDLLKQSKWIGAYPTENDINKTKLNAYADGYRTGYINGANDED